jgi:hypothetical protein
MKGLHKRGRAVLAALLLATLAAGSVPAAPAAVAPEGDGSLVAWLDGWLARLLPGWAVAGSESEEPPPGSEGIAFDDPASIETCDPTMPETCDEGEGLPDLDPDG